jgi:Glycosyl hydrolases family 16
VANDPPRTLDRSAFELEFDEAFDGPNLDEGRWVAAYLPHWSTPGRSAARYAIGDGWLRLLIEADQPPWCPELDGQLRVSSIQTAEFAGPVGSTIGGHHFREDAVVRSAQVNRSLYTPRYGLIELRCRALDDPRSMVAIWMIGVGDTREHSGEICIAEIFGRDVGPSGARVGMGIHPFGDPAMVDDFIQVDLAIDVREPHSYSAAWHPDGVAWYVNDRLVRVVDGSPDYPMQLILSLYEFPPDDGEERSPADYPKVFEVDWVRGYRPRSIR